MPQEQKLLLNYHTHNSPMKTVIIEDEKKSREGLKNLIEEFCEGVTVAGMADNVVEGLKLINEAKPDLVLLDIEMQSATGFDLLEKIENPNFEVVFTTAYEHYAIKAIKFSALDYLLKPIDVQELKAAIEKAGKKRLQSADNEQIKLLVKNLQLENPKTRKITLSTSEGLVFIPVKEIIRCEAQGAYTDFHLKTGKKIMVSKNLKEYENLLSDAGFFRIHNSHLVNLGEIERFIKSDGGYAVMKDGAKVAVSQNKKEEFLELMKDV